MKFAQIPYLIRKNKKKFEIAVSKSFGERYVPYNYSSAHAESRKRMRHNQIISSKLCVTLKVFTYFCPHQQLNYEIIFLTNFVRILVKRSLTENRYAKCSNQFLGGMFF